MQPLSKNSMLQLYHKMLLIRRFEEAVARLYRAGTIPVGSIPPTARLVVVDEAFSPCGLGGEIAALAADEAFDYLDSPIKRIHSVSVSDPMSPSLESAMLPGDDHVIAAVREIMNQ